MNIGIVITPNSTTCTGDTERFEEDILRHNVSYLDTPLAQKNVYKCLIKRVAELSACCKQNLYIRIRSNSFTTWKKLSYDKQTLIHEVDEAAMLFLALRYDRTVLCLLVCVDRSSLIWCVLFLFSCLLNVISLSWKILAHFQQFLSRPWSALARCYQIG